MHGCSNAYLVYGFNMGDREYIIDCDYLESEFPDIYQYALDVVKNYLGEAIYGISCGLNDKTGQVFISDEDKEQVNELYNKYIEYVKTNFDLTYKKLIKKIKLGFHLAVSGDYLYCHKKLILDDDWEEEKESKQELTEIGIWSGKCDKEPPDEIAQKTYKGVYYSDAMDMETAMRIDAENTRKLRHMIEEPDTSLNIKENDNVKAILKNMILNRN